MALRRKKHNSRFDRKRPIDHHPMAPYLARYLEMAQVQAIAQPTLRRRDSALRRFIQWCDERGIDDVNRITKPILESYQRHLYYYRQDNGEPLSVGSQYSMLTPIKSFFKWLTQENYLLTNPASELVLPKKPKALPRYILSIDEVMLVLGLPDIDTPSGLRDKAILELLYSTGIRRSELTALHDSDIDSSRVAVLIRGGKGNKDRYLPLGERALHWVNRYRYEARARLLINPSQPSLFFADYGEALNGGVLGHLVKRYLKQANIDKPGACHLFRHAMATHMLENGADIRFIQAMLGHADLSTTEIYTRVSIEKLREIHAVTHPARWPQQDNLADDEL